MLPKNYENFNESLIDQQNRYDKCEKSLSYFIKQSWHVIEPLTPYIHNWHIDYISEHLELAYKGEIRKLVINEPPGHMKSIQCTICFPAWVWTKDPYKRFINASYAQDLSTELSVKRRHILDSEWYQKGWSDKVQFSKAQNLKTSYTNTNKGFMFSTSVGGAVTGRHADYIGIDDPHNPLEARSDVRRQQAIDFVDSTISTRFTDKKTGVTIVIMQRLHERDLSGYLLKEKGFFHLKLPAESEGRTIYSFPISKRIFTREDGDLIWPEREDAGVIEEMKISLGPYNYAGQYQQRPAPAEGGMIKKSDLQFCDTIPEFDYSIWSWDLAMKANQKTDYVVGIHMVRSLNRITITKVFRDKVDYFDTKNEIIRQYKSLPANAVIIEDKANGPAVISDLQNTTLIPVIPENPVKDKVARLELELPTIRAHKLYILDGESWTADMVDELLLFPNAAHDDICDALTQGLLHFRTNTNNGMIDTNAKQETFAGPLTDQNKW